MTTIIPKLKYCLEKQTFKDKIPKEEQSKALSYTYERIIYDENNDNFEYIIFANGNRAKDVTKDGIHPYGQKDYTKRISDFFKKQNKNCVIVHILVDNDAPLNLESKIIAEKIEQLAANPKANTINLIGHSKCGAMFFNMPKYFRNESTYKKCLLYTSATPFQGCLIATPNLFLNEVQQAINAQLPFPINYLVYEALKKYYNSINSNSHMDNDIALKGYQSQRYDPNFIANMFDRSNIEAVKKLYFYQNFVTGIDDLSLYNSLKRRDFTSVGMCLMDRYFMQETTDGFIEVKSQESIKEYLDTEQQRVQSATHYYLSHDDELEIILNRVNQNINEFLEEKLGIKNKLTKTIATSFKTY